MDRPKKSNEGIERGHWLAPDVLQQALKMYSFMIRKLDEVGVKDVGVCKETLEMWNALSKTFPKMHYQKMTCNCVW
jgi:flagellin-specific chaperone FliS